MQTFRALVICLCALALSACQNQKSENPIQDTLELTNEFITKNNIPGLAITVSVKGKNVFSKGFGYSKVKQESKVDPSKTKFRIASISKPLTADALIHLSEENKLYLDSTIQYYIPDFPKKKGKITSRMLAGHLAGIRDYKEGEIFNTKHYDNIDDALEVFENDSLISYPGEEFHYSTYGWNLLGRVVEKASGKEFLSYMQEHVFDPLEMHNTIADHSDSIMPNRTEFYECNENNQIVNAPFVDCSIKWAGAGFLSTSEDMIRFANAHCKTGYLNQKQLDDLIRSQETSKGKKTYCGIGWFSGEGMKGYYFYGHAGNTVGGTSELVIYPKEEICVAVLTNLSDVKFKSFSHDIARLFMN